MKWLYVILFLAFVQCKQRELPYNDKIGKGLPAINLLLSDSSSFINTHEILKSDNVVFVFFDPYCPYCQGEIEGIIKNIDSFKNTTFGLLSAAPISDLKYFTKRYELNRYSNIYVGLDTAAGYAKYFGVKYVPHTSVFAKGKLIRVFTSKVDAKAILGK